MSLEKIIDDILAEFDCQTATLHRAAGEMLHMVHSVGIPAQILDKVKTIPFGKGIAGVAAATQEPVELCNLQQDLGGVAKEGARKTGVAGSLAIALINSEGAVVGTIGIGKVSPHDFSDEEKERLKIQSMKLLEFV